MLDFMHPPAQGFLCQKLFKKSTRKQCVYSPVMVMKDLLNPFRNKPSKKNIVSSISNLQERIGFEAGRVMKVGSFAPVRIPEL